MPAKSKAQQQLFAIAEHNPEKLRKENKGLRSVSKEKLHEFSATSTRNLPKHFSKPKKTR